MVSAYATAPERSCAAHVSDVLLCFVGGGWDLDGEPGAVLQTILRVHVQHLIIDSSPSPARRFLSHSRQTPGTYFSLSLPLSSPSHLSVGQHHLPQTPTSPCLSCTHKEKQVPVSSCCQDQSGLEGWTEPVTHKHPSTSPAPLSSARNPPTAHPPTLSEFGMTSR